ncbi:unnamed protein product, partial [Phaeothamnion confervicola]
QPAVAASVASSHGDVFKKATRRAVGGGASGAAAAVVQVLSLMWLRTIMNYQYRYGTTTAEAFSTLYVEGGVPRLYQGLPFALLQGPLSRFGDTAANAGVLLLLDSLSATASLPLPLKSAGGSAAAGLWRVLLMPIDALKTACQVEGAGGLPLLREKVEREGFGALYQGALAASLATFVGHYPWFFVYNSLSTAVPPAPDGDAVLGLARNAFIGLCASCASDICSNSVRVVKTTKQARDTPPFGLLHKFPISYGEAIRMVVDADGVAGLLGRGLRTRLGVNALQGALFSVAWKYFDGALFAGTAA